MKKLLSIFLLATMMLYSVGFYIAHRYNIKVVKREMRIAIASRQYHPDQLFVIEIPLRNDVPVSLDFEKVDKNEFRYKGEMYDIVTTEFKTDKVVYTCINDKEEAQLITVFSNQIQQQTDHPPLGKKTATLAKFAATNYTIAEAISIEFLSVFTNFSYTAAANGKLSVTYQHIPSPPPWLV